MSSIYTQNLGRIYAFLEFAEELAPSKAEAWQRTLIDNTEWNGFDTYPVRFVDMAGQITRQHGEFQGGMAMVIATIAEREQEGEA